MPADLNLSNRPVRTRMPGGVAEDAEVNPAPLCRLMARLLFAAPESIVHRRLRETMSRIRARALKSSVIQKRDLLS